jgi:hypothetical protein
MLLLNDVSEIKKYMLKIESKSDSEISLTVICVDTDHCLKNHGIIPRG